MSLVGRTVSAGVSGLRLRERIAKLLGRTTIVIVFPTRSAAADADADADAETEFTITNAAGDVVHKHTSMPFDEVPYGTVNCRCILPLSPRRSTARGSSTR